MSTYILNRAKYLLEKWESRNHDGPEGGPCFSAMGQAGCPCCDAGDELMSMIGALIGTLSNLESDMLRIIAEEHSRVFVDKPIGVVGASDLLKIRDRIDERLKAIVQSS